MPIVNEALEVYGDLDSGLTIIATLPRHLAGDRGLVRQHMLLTVADSRVLAEKLVKKHAAFLVAHDLEKVTDDRQAASARIHAAMLAPYGQGREE